MTNNDKSFIGWAVAECNKRGIRVIFEPRSFVVADNEECVGFFNDGDKELVVATRVSFKKFLSNFLHEFCHFRQWLTKEPSYMKIYNDDNLGADMWDWLEGKEIPIKRVIKSIHAYRKMELNCEKMAVSYIDQFKLSIDKEQYIQSANIYVLFYGMLEETRKWFKYSPYEDKQLLKIIPKNLIKDFKLPKGFKKRVMSICY